MIGSIVCSIKMAMLQKSDWKKQEPLTAHFGKIKWNKIANLISFFM